MKRGESLMISVRVPLKGEVARLEADKDSVLVVNKLNNTYVRESLEQASKLADITLSDLQDVFIGRVFIAGKGTLTKKRRQKGRPLCRRRWLPCGAVRAAGRFDVSVWFQCIQGRTCLSADGFVVYGRCFRADWIRLFRKRLRNGASCGAQGQAFPAGG